MKSPIKESNKFRSLRELKRMIPRGSIINSFLFFDGGLEFNLSASGRFIVAHTHKDVIYEFWQCALEDSPRVAGLAKSLCPIEDPNTFHILQERWPTYDDPYARAALFFILNRCSESGMISAGRLAYKNFNPVALGHLRNFSPVNFYLKRDDHQDLIKNLKEVDERDYVLVPVGAFNYNLFERGKNRGYEMTTVHHQQLYEAMQEREKKWVILYKPHPQLFKLYDNYNIKMINKSGLITTDRGDCEEVLIANF